MGNLLSENNKKDEVEEVKSEIPEVKSTDEENKESLKTDSIDGTEVASSTNSTDDNKVSITPRTLIQAPIICPKGQRPDRYGICRSIF